MAPLRTRYTCKNLRASGSALRLPAKEADAILEMFNKNASKYHREGSEDMKAYKIGYTKLSEGIAESQEERLIFED